MGVLMPTCVSAIFLIYPEEHRGASMGIYGLVIGVAPVFGPVISGVICDYASWHLIYYITASLSAITVILGIFLLEPIHLTEINNTKISKLSIVMCVIGFGLLLFGFGDVGSRGFSLVSGISIALGLIVSTCFFIYQSKIDNPMLNISVLKSRNFTVSVVIMMCVHAAILGNSILVPLLIQDVMGHTATVSGLVMTPPAIVMGVLSPITGRFFDKHGPRGMCISGLLILTLTTIFLSCLDKNFTAFYLCIVLCLRYVGLALVNMPINT